MPDTEDKLPVLIKRYVKPGVPPRLYELLPGELALNIPDAKLYTRKSLGDPVEDTVVVLNPDFPPPKTDQVEVVTLTYRTSRLDPRETERFTLTTPELLAFLFLEIELSKPAWLRVYDSATSRSADTRGNPGGQPVTGLYAEVNTSGVLLFNPVALVPTKDNKLYVSVVNMYDQATPVNLTFKGLGFFKSVPVLP